MAQTEDIRTVRVWLADSRHGDGWSLESVVVVSELERREERSAVVSERYVMMEFTRVHHDGWIQKLELHKRQCCCRRRLSISNICIVSFGFKRYRKEHAKTQLHVSSYLRVVL